MKRLVALLILFIGVTVFESSVLAAGPDASGFVDERPTQKLAFVLGNSLYADQGNIPSAETDARQVAASLRGLGFSVIEVHNVKRAPDFWTVSFMPFVNRIKENDFVVFFYSGHGLNYGNENFIAMTDYPKSIQESEITDYLIALSSLRELITSRKAGLSLLLFDACRSIASNIKKDGVAEGVGKGMVAPRITVENVAIGFSSDFGKISKGRDTPGTLSYYTEALLAHLSDEDKEYSYVKRQTRLKLLADTFGEQTPWFSESLSAEIYLKPSLQLISAETKVWMSRLAANDYDQVWSFTQEFPVSRYVGAAKRWLQQHSKAKLLRNTTKVSPQSLDNAFSADDPTKRIQIPRVDGPFAFNKIANITKPVEDTATAGKATIAEVIGPYDKLVVTRNITAKASPDENGQPVENLPAGAIVNVKSVTESSSGSAWLEFGKDGSSAYLPVNRALVGTTDVGYSLAEVEVKPDPGLASLVDEKPIYDALASLRANGRSISRVSVAVSPTIDAQLQLRLKGRVAHVFYLLQQNGISASIISSAVAADANDTGGLTPSTSLGENVRVRFFGH
ncbi:caspase family protein [Bradyrhizobium guangxiense]